MPILSSFNKQLTVITGGLLDDAVEYVSLLLDSTSYDEGDTITATVNTRNVVNGTTVDYTVTGVSASDLSTGSLNGTITINSNTGTVAFDLAQDGLTEGVDTFTITLVSVDSNGTATGSLNDSATIQDTSNDPTRTPWLDDNDDIITVAQIVSPLAMQVNAVFAVNPTVPISVEGRTSGTTTTIVNITANTGSILEVDDDGNSTNFIVGEELNIQA